MLLLIIMMKLYCLHGKAFGLVLKGSGGDMAEERGGYCRGAGDLPEGLSM